MPPLNEVVLKEKRSESIGKSSMRESLEKLNSLETLSMLEERLSKSFSEFGSEDNVTLTITEVPTTALFITLGH